MALRPHPARAACGFVCWRSPIFADPNVDLRLPVKTFMRRNLMSQVMLALVLAACGQSTTNQRVVRVMAEVQPTQPFITLHWQEYADATGYTVFRRLAGATTWSAAIATLPASALAYQDATVGLGTAYEYKVERSAASTGYGYVRSGMDVPQVDYRGRIILVVGNGLNDVLSEEIAQLENDLNGDGWIVVRHDLEATATPPDVRALVQADQNDAPEDVKALYLLGHVPVAYTGDHAPDGHSYHQGAWPCDGYYGDVNGEWTDDAVTSNASSWPWNHNEPGDGKFDQSDFPDSVELAVGRVDLSNLTVFDAPEADLLADYLDRAHAWKTAQFTVPSTAVVWDNLEWAEYPLAVSGYMSAVPCVGIDSVTQLDPLQGRFSEHYLNNDDLFTCHVSTGLKYDTQAYSIFPGTDHGLNDTDLVSNTRGGVFNLSLGSYYGDWDNRDNFLRALIAKGNALAHMWSGMPNWYLHPMAMGETVGYCAMRTMNNTNADYALQNGGWQGQSMEQAHMTLMGDPSLRMRYIPPPTGLVSTNEQWFARFTWSPSPAAVDGYHIYRINDQEGIITRITDEPVQDTVFLSDLQFVPGGRYMVRALQLVTSASGSYYDLSLGSIAVAQGKLLADCEGVIGGAAIPGTPCDDGNVLTQGETYDLSCECVAAPIGIGENGTAAAIVLWPTPAGDVLQVSTRYPGGTWVVRSMDGAEVLRGRMATGVQRINAGSLASGTYVMEYRSTKDARPVFERFTVQH